jgi:large subunit ribosomal protein L23
MTNQKKIPVELKLKTEGLAKWEEFLLKTKDQFNLINTTSGSLKVIDLVKYPVITEKTYLNFYKNRQYTFDVDKRLTKSQIQKLFENLFNVKITAVNTHIPPRHKIRVGMTQGFRPTYKRAIITLKEGYSITF